MGGIKVDEFSKQMESTGDIEKSAKYAEVKEPVKTSAKGKTMARNPDEGFDALSPDEQKSYIDYKKFMKKRIGTESRLATPVEYAKHRDILWAVGESRKEQMAQMQAQQPKYTSGRTQAVTDEARKGNALSEEEIAKMRD